MENEASSASLDVEGLQPVLFMSRIVISPTAGASMAMQWTGYVALRVESALTLRSNLSPIEL